MKRWIFLAAVLIFLCVQIFMYRDTIPTTQPSVSNPTISAESVETSLGVKTYRELEDAIFRPLGYTLRENLVVPGLDYTEPLNCPKLFSDWLVKAKAQNESGTPPKLIPEGMEKQFTLGGHVHLIMHYSDERSGTNHRTWDKKYIDEYVNQDVKKASQYSGDVWALYYAMTDYGVKGQKGLVVGSLSPYAEGYALKAGAKHVTTVEYTKIDVVGDDRIDYKHPIDIAEKAQDHIGTYDFIASFSSLEHSGLGRYGDALDPIGDFKEAMKVQCMLKENGLFFIGLPMGWDTVYWNLHRIYGRIRYAMFSAGFDVLGVYYQDKMRNGALTLDMFAIPEPKGQQHQYLVVLRKRS